MSKNFEIPQSENLFLDTPLYSSYQINDTNYKAIIDVEFFTRTLDTYCTGCGRESIFAPKVHMPPIGPAVASTVARNSEELVLAGSAYFPQESSSALAPEVIKTHALKDRTFIAKFECNRDRSHRLYFYFIVSHARLTKIGQYPSIADLQTDTLKKYRKVLGEDQHAEFNRAIRLNANGIGIGALIYLRRIFENLIEGADANASRIEGRDEGKFTQSRMDEKIQLLHEYLPRFLVDNRSMYSILSSGIHPSLEEECLEMFEPIKTAIELILDEKIEQEEKNSKINLTKNKLQSIISNLKNSFGFATNLSSSEMEKCNGPKRAFYARATALQNFFWIFH